jgi:hypothetical protein
MKWLFSLAVAASFLGIFPQAFAQAAEVVPKLINYQGKLTDATGLPLAGDAGGTFRLKFEIFAQADGGSAVWAEERDVVVIGGIFNVALGGAGGDEVVGISNDIGEAFAGPSRFLQTTIVSGPTITEAQTLAPRQQLASTPFAMVSQTADRAAVADRAIVASVAESLIPELVKLLNPPGTIITYAGDVGNDTGGLIEPIPGYLLCNGAVIDGAALDGKYSALRTALGNAWGNGGNAANLQVVNLPDLRGVFLRGWSGAATDGYADPDRNGRLARRSGGNAGNSVGSFQPDELKSHRHIGRYTNNAASGTSRGTHASGGYSDGGTMDFTGGSETRPKNANVVYLIKY